jgi:2-dehydro-3-deoxyphosphooctonate aldolase (KDO 8-P synthase)
MGNHLPLTVIAGPCVIEGRAFALETAQKLKSIFSDAGISWIYKSSFDKANRSSVNSFRGVGMDEGLSILAEVRQKVGVSVLTDVHEKDQIGPVAQTVDMLQTPAFLCRQTDLIVKAAQTGRVVNVKKGQFLAPWDMKNVATKLVGAGCRDYFFTERGTTFGYNNLVADMRSIPWMQELGAQVVFDATHSVQRPGGAGDTTSGDGALAPVLARSAVSALMRRLNLLPPFS